MARKATPGLRLLLLFFLTAALLAAGAAALLSRVGMLRLFSSFPRGELLNENDREELRRHVDYAREALRDFLRSEPGLELLTGTLSRK
jgi:hypothetical protein